VRPQTTHGWAATNLKWSRPRSRTGLPMTTTSLGPGSLRRGSPAKAVRLHVLATFLMRHRKGCAPTQPIRESYGATRTLRQAAGRSASVIGGPGFDGVSGSMEHGLAEPVSKILWEPSILVRSAAGSEPKSEIAVTLLMGLSPFSELKQVYCLNLEQATFDRAGGHERRTKIQQTAS
jgi:hypothetical protein